MADSDENKVFDVAKPGSSKPDTGSKPMVVGHKIMKDPTLTEDADQSKETEEVKMAQSSKITINPVSEEFVDNKIEDTEAKKTDDNEQQADEKVEPETNKPKETTEETNKEEPIVEKTAEEKKESEAEEEMLREENLQKIIKEKTYNLPIEEASYSAVKTFLKTFIVVGIIGLIVVVLLIDAEIIDLGITLPFDIL